VETDCTCCGTELFQPGGFGGDGQCSRCALGGCRCRLTAEQEADADRKVDAMAERTYPAPTRMLEIRNLVDDLTGGRALEVERRAQVLRDQREREQS
jgi:predicted  nucleic acid-binding Zn-ribbon protein